jgi:hypothetical protein
VNVIDPVTLVRLNSVIASGFQNETELADAILKFISQIGKDLLDGGSLNEEETRGVRLTLNDTPITFAALTSFPLPEEQKANLVFMLAKLMDDMLSLGATAMTAGNKDIALRVLNGGVRGGNRSTVTRRQTQKEWQALALTLATGITQKNNRLTQDDLETKIRDRWQKGWPRLPGRKSIIDLLSKAQGDGRLPRHPK